MIACMRDVCSIVRLLSNGTKVIDTAQKEAILGNEKSNFKSHMMVIARRYRNIPIMPAACLSALLSGLVCWPLGDPLAITSHELLILVLFGIVNSAVGLALFTLGARHLPAIETALIGSLDAPLAPLWVWLAFNETPGASTIMGALIVFAAVCVHLIAGTLRRKTQFEPAIF